MPAMCIALALAIVVVAAIAIVKKLDVRIVLLVAGMALNILALAFGAENILPKGAQSTGLVFFDLFEAFDALSLKQITGTGFIMLLAGGFATYMGEVGASDKLVDLCMKPLSHIKHPYLILVLVFVVGHLLSLVITTAAGLAMLLAITVFPLLTRMGISGVSVAAILASPVMFSWCPSSALAPLGADVAKIDPMEYLLSYQIYVGVPLVLAMAVTHYFWQKYMDVKDHQNGRIVSFSSDSLQKTEQKVVASKRNVPMVYALLPLVPIVLLLIFNKTVSGSIVLSVACAMVIGWCTALLVDAVCRRDLKTVFHDASSFFNGMGTMLTKVVSLIFVAALFVAGLQNAGVVSALISASKSFGLGLEGTGIVVSGAISIITLLTGSGVAAFTSLVPIAPDLAHALGGNTAALAVMMQVGAETVRAMSPVAGVVIIVAGFAKVSPLEVSRRCIVPSVVGYVVGISCAAILL